MTAALVGVPPPNTAIHYVFSGRHPSLGCRQGATMALPHQRYKIVRILEKNVDFRRSGQFYVEGINEARSLEEWVNIISREGWDLHSLSAVNPAPGQDDGFVAVFEARPR